MVQRLFSSSPRDPRYHMLSYISSKFSEAPTSSSHEPRAALFLNRFTRTSTIMYATNSVSSILGIRPDQLISKSFYFCIAENCLQDAVRCLESAKANDSIAYLRFWFRNPLLGERNATTSRTDTQSSDEDDDEGGVRLQRRDQASAYGAQPMDTSRPQSQADGTNGSTPHAVDDGNQSRSTSENSTDSNGNANDAIFDQPTTGRSSTSSLTPADDMPLFPDPIEVEAVVSCTSDGLVVIIRRARPAVPQSFGTAQPPNYQNGLFATPWALNAADASSPSDSQAVEGGPVGLSAAASISTSTSGPDASTLLNTIREVAVFAWSLTGINGSLIQHKRGEPEGEALPPDGLPVWDPFSDHPENDRFNGFADNSHRRTNTEFNEGSSSEDEIVFKRAKVMPEFRKPERRAHRDAFSAEDEPRDGENGRAPAQKRKMGR